MSSDLIATLLILIAAVTWAGRKVWRLARHGADPDGCGGGCRGSSCGRLPQGDNARSRDQR
ncbi:MAG: FeoB-associated Cys-rich membrane protein [Candidatus Krumholzibacteria bacterium]|jgi:hypothetical protein|nr:FeoB-associated Cys-rich membrane protein [Candidatus Krumholzibacteria bacterium]